MIHEKNKYELFGFGFIRDIQICKKNCNREFETYCLQYEYNYNGIENALTGTTGENNPFTPKTITVIQMI